MADVSILGIVHTIQQLQSITDQIPSDDPSFSLIHSTLARSFHEIYQYSSDPNILQLALRHAQTAVQATPADSPYLPDRQITLALIHLSERERIDKANDLEMAVVLCQQAVTATPLGHPLLSQYLDCLCLCYHLRVGHLRCKTDIDASLRCCRGAVEATCPDDAHLIPGRQHDLAVAYSKRHRVYGDISDLQLSVFYARQAVIATPLGTPEFSQRLQSLAERYLDRYRLLNDSEDLDAFLKFGEASMGSIEEDFSVDPEYLSALAEASFRRFYRIKHQYDLELSLTCGKKAVDNTPVNHPKFPSCIRHLAIACQAYYDLTNDVKYLEETCRYLQLAMDNIPTDHPILPEILHHFARVHFSFHDRFGDLTHLELALKHVRAIPRDSDLRLMLIQDAGCFYLRRHTRLGDLKDLETATTLFTDAVKETSLGDPLLADLLNNVGIAYNCRYEIMQDSEDLKTAIKFLQTALDITPIDNPGLPLRRWTLQILRHVISDSVADVLAAQDAIEAGLGTTPLGGHPQPLISQVAAMTHMVRFVNHKPNIEDLLKSLIQCQLAVLKTPDDHPDLPIRQMNLAMYYMFCYHLFEHTESMEKSLQLFRLAIQSTIASPVHIWTGAAAWGSLASEHKLAEAMEAYSAAFAVLPDLVWLGNSLDSRHQALKKYNIPRCASSACAAALAHSSLPKAVEFFEAGLSVTHKQSLQLRNTGDMRLWTEFRDQAQELQSISLQLQAMTSASAFDHAAPATDPHELVLKRKQLIQTIRNRPGFETFLLPPTWDELKQAAEAGPVIILNATEASGDAIILLSICDDPIRISLPELSVEILQNLLKHLRNALAECRIVSRDVEVSGSDGGGIGTRHGKKSGVAPADQIFERILGFLWSKVVSPVFKCLCSNGVIDGRIWWCPSGPFTYLPIHAAAPVDYKFVQSYTYTLGSLIQARQRNNADHPSDNRHEIVTAVAVSNAIRAPPLGPLRKLSNVGREVQAIADIIKKAKTAQIRLFIDSAANHSKVASALQRSHWLHFACHGQQDADEPLSSGLELFDRRLWLGEILDLNALETAKFVYLSACETAMGDGELGNEAMHLVGAFMTAGFCGAIGTLWSMADEYGPEVASCVYRKVFGADGNNCPPRLELAAEGLWDGVRKIREKGAAYHQWIPFIHAGI